LEIELRKLAASEDIPAHEVNRMGARQLLDLAQSRRWISSGSVEMLRYATSIANRAVHGFDVPPEDAHAAIKAALIGFRELKDHGSEGGA
jgi:hypothetical protein